MYPSLGISSPPFTLSNIRLLAQTPTFISWAPCLNNTQLQAPNRVWCWCVSLGSSPEHLQAHCTGLLKHAEGSKRKMTKETLATLCCFSLQSSLPVCPMGPCIETGAGGGSDREHGQPWGGTGDLGLRFSVFLWLRQHGLRIMKDSLSPACLLNDPYTFSLNKRQQPCLEQDARAEGCRMACSSCTPHP